MRKVQIYIETEVGTFKRIELFNDETIQINMSVQNVQDIAKVFTEFSQSFTIPASPYNNQIFQHFYENAVDAYSENGAVIPIDHQRRRNARIEVDLIPFRTGRIQLEKSNVKNGRVESYTITFFGDIVTLKDIFGEDKLDALDYTEFVHTYTGAEVINRVTSATNYDVRYPLISSERFWTYGSGSHNIAVSSGHIHFTELFPALRVSKIFEKIQTKYGIQFDSVFFNTKRFQNLFLWLKNKAKFEFTTKEQVVDIANLDADSRAEEPVTSFFDITNNTFKFKTNTQNNNAFGTGFYESRHKLEYKVVTLSDPTAKVYFQVFKNGVLFKSLESVDVTNYVKIEEIFYFLVTNVDVYTFKIHSDKPTSIRIYFNYEISGQTGLGVSKKIWYGAYSTIQVLTNDVNINDNVPDMKIADFVSGIFKQFNLTCTPITKTKFKIETLETWYAIGRLIDVTKYIDIDSIDIERVKLFKKITFKHQKSESFYNYNFNSLFKREYGDLEQVFNYDGGDYTIELPYETMLHSKFTNTQLQVGYSLDKDQNPVIPKALVLYMNERTDCDFYMNDGVNNQKLLKYLPFGQDVIENGNNYSLNFGAENSSFYDSSIDYNIYNVYYRNYLQNLYNPKQRLTYIKGIFPTAILTSLQLNDRLIIRDKRYIINEIKTNLNTGDVDLVLLHDFRQLEAIDQPLVLNNNVTTGTINIALPTGADVANFDSNGTGVTASPSTLTSSGTITVTVPPIDNVDVLTMEDGIIVITDDYATLAGEDNPYQVNSTPLINFLMNNGETIVTQLNISQIAVVG